MSSFGHLLTIDLDALPATVWSVIADYRRDPEWREGVQMSVEPAGLVRDGSITREQLRVLGAWQSTTAHIRDVEPGRAFRFVSEDGTIEGTRTVEPAPSASRVTVQLRVAVPWLLAPLAPALGWMFRRRVRRDLARLARLVGTAAHASPAGAPSASERAVPATSS